MTEKVRNQNEEIIRKNTETVCKKIEELLVSIPFEDLGYMRSQAAETLVTEALIWGSFNDYEAVGICEVAKKTYLDITEKVHKEELATK